MSVIQNRHLQDSSFLGGRCVTYSGRLWTASPGFDNGVVTSNTHTLQLVVHVLQRRLLAAALADQLEAPTIVFVNHNASSYDVCSRGCCRSTSSIICHLCLLQYFIIRHMCSWSCCSSAENITSLFCLLQHLLTYIHRQTSLQSRLKDQAGSMCVRRGAGGLCVCLWVRVCVCACCIYLVSFESLLMRTLLPVC